MGANAQRLIIPTTARDMSKKGPLKLLDLPRDVLELIVNEVTYTNDLASLALTHSALYALVVPRIYCRFDIVWPDKQSASDTYAGVDALTYGLSTLVTSGGAIRASRDCCVEEAVGTPCPKCNSTKSEATRPVNPRRPLRRLHHLAQYIRRFAIANGPQECIEEYYVATECGKMLGTLTALAIARMPRLETFTWDMPTGISRDVWVSLSSLGESPDSRFEKLWVRCPDGRVILEGDENSARTANAMNPARTRSRRKHKRSKRSSNFLDYSYSCIESPSFSLLTPVKSITVLEMVEPAYLHELSIALATSLETLRELRLSVVSLFYGVDWATADRAEFYTKKSADTRLGFLANGGVLGLLMKEIYDCRKGPKPTTSLNSSRPGSLLERVGALVPNTSNLHFITGNEAENTVNAANSTGNAANSSHQVEDGASSEGDLVGLSSAHSTKKRKPEKCGAAVPSERKKLRLEILGLEKITIRCSVLRHTIHWECLTSLTLLNCGSDEKLWKHLTNLYGPAHEQSPIQETTSRSESRGVPETVNNHRPSRMPMEYRLSLKKIHTNRVSSALITFLKKALAPNSLEQLFLQETNPPSSKVTVDEIYHGPIRHHQTSLEKLSIDSVHSRDPSVPPIADPTGDPGNATSKGKKWAMSRKVLSFITSGKMSKLRELAVVIDYRDWHFLLQGLPRIPHLRTLYLPYIMNHPFGGAQEALELAKQVLNVATLRSEMELAYLAIWQRCFEIVENNGEPPVIATQAKDGCPGSAASRTSTDEDSYEDEDDDDDDDEDDEHVDEDDEHVDEARSDEDPSALHDDSSTFTMSEASLSGDDCGDVGSQSKKGKVKVKRLKLKLGEILFCDDRVSVFKARHGKLC